MIEEKCFHPKKLFFLTKSFSVPAVYFHLFDTTRPEHAWQKFRRNHPPWKANQFPHSHKCEEGKIHLEGKYLLFLSFAYLLMHRHTVYFFLTYVHAQGLCLKGKNIFSFLFLRTRTRYILFFPYYAHTQDFFGA